MEEEKFYKVIADAISHNEDENNYRRKGNTNITFDGYQYYISYVLMELEGYEDPCYDVESSRCSPGGLYGLDTFVFENISVTDIEDLDVDIDIRELTYVYNEDRFGNLKFEKRIWIDTFYDE